MQERLARLAAGLPNAPAPGQGRQAAVAMLLRADEVLLMRRVERKGDRWSGQISLPGGHQDSRDANLLATAMRETQEEVCVDLERDARFLGCMPGMQARSDGGRLPMWISPFLFQSSGALDPEPGPEAASTFWLPLQLAHSGDLDQPFHWTAKNGLERRLPSWHYQDHIIWGMTHHLLTELNAQLFR